MAVKIMNGDRMEVSYEGAVLATRERNGYDDSDFYAVVWDEASKSLKEVEYATTRGWTYDNTSGVDATPEVLAKAGEWAVNAAFVELRERDAAKAMEPTKGKAVVVVKGRKVPVGTKATVFWYGNGRVFYGCPRGGYNAARPLPKRVGLTLSDGSKVFTDASNVKVTNPEDYLSSEADLKAAAERARDNPVGVHLAAGYSALSGMAIL